VENLDLMDLQDLQEKEEKVELLVNADLLAFPEKTDNVDQLVAQVLLDLSDLMVHQDQEDHRVNEVSVDDLVEKDLGELNRVKLRSWRSAAKS